VIGGGIAGLAAAYRLTRSTPTVAVTLLEAAPRLGGKIVTERADGFTIEGGPDSFLSIKPRGVGLCAELGITNRLRGTTPRPHRAYVARGDRLHELPEGLTGLVPTRLRPMLGTALLSPRGKARLIADSLLPPHPDGGDEALGAFVRRRLGGEVYERLVEPLMAGIYAGDGDRLSLAATFPHLRAAELAHGGLIRGVLAARAAVPAPVAGERIWPPFVSPARGMAELVDALAAALVAAGVNVRTGAGVTALRPVGGGYEIVLHSGERLSTDAVIVAVPAPVAAAVVADLDPDLAGILAAIPHASSAIVTLAYAEDELPRPLDAHGYVIPRAEGRPVLACTWTSAKWAGRAPTGVALIRVFVGRFGQDEMVAAPDADLVALARAELGRTLDVTAVPRLARVHRWPLGMPQYTLGHPARLDAIADRLAGHPALALAGAAYTGVSLPDCIRSGEDAATRVHAGLHPDIAPSMEARVKSPDRSVASGNV